MGELCFLLSSEFQKGFNPLCSFCSQSPDKSELILLAQNHLSFFPSAPSRGVFSLPRLRPYQEIIYVLGTQLNLLFWAIGYNLWDLVGASALSSVFLFSVPPLPLLTSEKVSKAGWCTILDFSVRCRCPPHPRTEHQFLSCQHGH